MIRNFFLILVLSCFIFAEDIKDINISKSSQPIVTLEQNGKKFILRREILFQYDELIKMVLATESMDDDERQYWFDIMPSMTDKQIERLYNILDTERKKLEALELKYQEEIKELNEKHLIEWSEFKVKEEIAKENNASDTDYEKVLEKL